MSKPIILTGENPSQILKRTKKKGEVDGKDQET